MITQNINYIKLELSKNASDTDEIKVLRNEEALLRKRLILKGKKLNHLLKTIKHKEYLNINLNEENELEDIINGKQNTC